MTIAEATKMAGKNGKIARKSWEGSAYIALNDISVLRLFIPHCDGGRYTGWQPLREDLTAEDWGVLYEAPAIVKEDDLR